MNKASEILDMVKLNKTEHQRLSDDTRIYLNWGDIGQYPAFPNKKLIQITIWTSVNDLKQIMDDFDCISDTIPKNVVIKITSTHRSVRGRYIGYNTTV
jgi:hypothetical protein